MRRCCGRSRRRRWARLRRSETGDDNLAGAWEMLRAASAAMDSEAAADEYNNLFVGVGKCEVNLHASHWLTGFMMEKPLAELRATLARLGLARRPEANLVEDHRRCSKQVHSRRGRC
jgi:TorA maturation chaperone TorD